MSWTACFLISHPAGQSDFRLFRFPDYPEDAPRSFTVSAEYLGPEGKFKWDSQSVLDLDQWAEALADPDYENKNWNEFTRQTKAQQDLAKAMSHIASAAKVMEEFLEQTPALKELREEQGREGLER